MQFTGIIKEAEPLVNGTSKAGKAYQRQNFVLEEQSDAQYKSSVYVTCLRPNILSWMAANIGKEVTIDIDPRVREYNGKHYQDLVCWGCTYNGTKIGVEQAAAEVQQAAPQPQTQTYYAKNIPSQEYDDTMPF